MINFKCKFNDDCSKCEVCKYDLPLDAVFNKERNKMKEFGIIPMANNPSTAQIIIPGTKREQPFGKAMEIGIPLKNAENKDVDLYCNGCEYLSRIARPNSDKHNCRCKADTIGINQGGGRVIALKCSPGEKIKKPFWCPVLKDKIINNPNPSKGLILPINNNSAMSPEQQAEWNASRARIERKNKWKAINGLCSWDDIKVGCDYHLPPTPEKERADIHVTTKYMTSFSGHVIGTEKRMWFYKGDEDYKFMSPIVR